MTDSSRSGNVGEVADEKPVADNPAAASRFVTAVVTLMHVEIPTGT